jgi:short-subunit dehydrogenase
MQPILYRVTSQLRTEAIVSKTALITGASAGIGYELTKIFAKNGYDLVLVSRNGQGLKPSPRKWKINMAFR